MFPDPGLPRFHFQHRRLRRQAGRGQRRPVHRSELALVQPLCRLLPDRCPRRGRMGSAVRLRARQLPAASRGPRATRQGGLELVLELELRDPQREHRTVRRRLEGNRQAEQRIRDRRERGGNPSRSATSRSRAPTSPTHPARTSSSSTAGTSARSGGSCSGSPARVRTFRRASSRPRCAGSSSWPSRRMVTSTGPGSSAGRSTRATALTRTGSSRRR